MTSSSAENESALAARACRGDRSAVRQLLLRNWPWMRALAWAAVGDPHDTDDLLQDVCVRVLDRIGTLRDPERFRPWLAALVRNQAISFRRRRRRRPATLVPEQAERIVAEKLPDELEAEEERQRLREAIEKLPPKYREVLMLQLTGRYSYADIAELLGLAVTTVQVRLVRARRMVYDHMMGIPVEKVPRT